MSPELRPYRVVDRNRIVEPPTYDAAERLRFYRMLLYIENERSYRRGWARNKHRERFGDWPAADFAAPLPPDASCRAWVRATLIRYAKSMQREAAS